MVQSMFCFQSMEWLEEHQLGWITNMFMFNLSIAGRVHVEDQKLAINVSAGVLAQDSTRPSAGAVLTKN